MSREGAWFRVRRGRPSPDARGRRCGSDSASTRDWEEELERD